MKKTFLFVCTLLIMGCSDDIKSLTIGSPTEPTVTEQAKPNESIPEGFFEQINLEYPGLEKVKKQVEENRLYDAAKELLAYYRMRLIPYHPTLNLMNVSATESEIKIADYALENRFYVKNFYEDDIQKVPLNFEKDGKINWQYWPTKANEQQYQLHRHQWFIPQAKTYRLTKDEKYIKNWIKVYKDWCQNNPIPTEELDYTKDPYYGDREHMWQIFAWRPLEASSRVDAQLELFNYYLHSENFTPDFLSYFLMQFRAQVNHIVKNYTATGNHRILQSSSVAYAGVLFPELNDAATWLESGSTVLSEEMKKQLLPDGVSYELDLGYHMAELSSFSGAYKCAVVNQRADAYPSDFVENMRKGTNVVMNMVYPDYKLPAFNDTRPHSERVMKRNFKTYADLFPDNQEMLWMATKGSSGVKPTHLISSYKNSGLYALRNNWKDNATMMILTNGPKAGYHSQPDNGTFGLYYKTRNFFPDSGCFAYSGPNTNKDRAEYAQTRMHNTLTLNHKNVKSEGRFIKQSTEGNTEILTTENQGYDNLKHRRTVFFVDHKFFVLVDEAIGNASGTINLNYHLCRGTDTEVVLDLAENGAHTAFSDQANILIRCFGAGISSSAFDGKTSPNIGITYPRKAFSVDALKEANNNTRYITVILPIDDDATTHAINALFTDTGYSISGASLEVTIDGKTYPLSVNL